MCNIEMTSSVLNFSSIYITDIQIYYIHKSFNLAFFNYTTDRICYDNNMHQFLLYHFPSKIFVLFPSYLQKHTLQKENKKYSCHKNS